MDRIAMKGRIVSFDEARQRFADRVAERRDRNRADCQARESAARVPALQGPLVEQRRAEAQRAKRRWRMDLERWPRAFRERLDPYVRGMSDPLRITGPSSWSAKPGHSEAVDIAAIRRSGLKWDFDQNRVLGSVHRLATSARRSRAHLEHWKTHVLWQMWIHGVRKIERRPLEEAAREALPVRELCLRAELLRLRRSLQASLHSRDRGTVRGGPRAGQPYTQAQRRRIETEIRHGQERIERAEWELSTLLPWAWAHPLRYALGCYPRWGQRPESDSPAATRQSWTIEANHTP
jgi:hypothetical protein